MKKAVSECPGHEVANQQDDLILFGSIQSRCFAVAGFVAIQYRGQGVEGLDILPSPRETGVLHSTSLHGPREGRCGIHVHRDFSLVFGEDTRRAAASSQFADNEGLSVLEGVNCGFASHGWKVIKRVVYSLPAFEIVQQGLKRSACPAKNRCTPEHFG